MPCYYPLKGYRSGVEGKGIVFSAKLSDEGQHLDIPCGQCIGCRLERSRQWATRIMHEAHSWEENSFLTLTYEDEHLPTGHSLDKTHFQKFMKRLRKKYPDQIIRYYQCGEYGDQTQRPHYHACMFNYLPKDKIHLMNTRDNHKLFTSEEISNLWPYGLHTIGELTFESAAYTARYCLKKVTGKDSEKHYESIDTETGELHQRTPEYSTMSRRPGIGKQFLEDFTSDIYPRDYVVTRGNKSKPPRYYDSQLELTDPDTYDLIKERRKNSVDTLDPEFDYERLRVKEQCKIAQTNQLKRQLQ